HGGAETKNGAAERPPRSCWFRFPGRSARVVLDHQVRLHMDRIGHVAELGGTHEHAAGLVAFDLEIARHIPLARLERFEDDDEPAGLFPYFDHVAVTHQIAGDIDPAAVDQHVAVIDELAGGEHGRHELHAVDNRVQTTFQQADQVFAG